MHGSEALTSSGIPSARVAVDARPLVLAVLAAGAANGLLRPTEASLLDEGWRALLGTFGVSVPALAGLVAACVLVWESAVGLAWHGIAAALAAGFAFLVPDSDVAWGGLTLFSAYLFAVGDARARAAALILLAVCINLFWAHLCLALFSAEITALDARLLGALLALFSDAVARQGNVIALGGGEALAVLAPCSSLASLSAGLVIWTTVTRFVHPRARPGEWRGILVLGFGIVAFNLLRMMLMAISVPVYWWVHGPAGAEIYNIVVVVWSLAVSLRLGLRHGSA